MLKQFAVYITIALLLYSCASQVAPTGGDKDIVPPAVSHSSPKNLTTHFNAHKINITFNEYVQQGDFASQIFFSPALNEKPLYRIHGRTLSITLYDTLKSQTTYTVNFGNAVKDITEGNIMLNYQYVFSTGDYIDSMKVRGIVKDAADGLPEENALVMLYSDLSDSVVAKERPTYYSHTDKEGSFEISHVKEGSYKLFALTDQNFNLLYDQPGEEVAFWDSAIVIKDTTGFYSMILFKPAVTKQKLLGANSPQPGKVTLALARRTDSLQVTPVSGAAKNGVLQFNAGKDTAYFFLDDFTSDSISLVLTDRNFSDTAAVRMKVVNEKEKIFAPKFTVGTVFKKGRSGGPQEPDKPFQFEFSTPVIFVNDQKSLQLINDSLKSKEAVKAVLVYDSITRKEKASVQFPFAEKTNYTLVIPDSVFRDVYGRFNDSSTLKFLTFEKTETGNLTLKITTDSLKHYFYDLYSATSELISNASLQPGLNELKFPSLRPGNYSLKVIEDLNANNRWDTGDYWKHLQPEKIYNYTEAITLRANWDLEIEMNVGVGKKLLKVK